MKTQIKMLLLAAVVITSCQSQAEKDRAEMEQLIDARFKLTKQLESIANLKLKGEIPYHLPMPNFENNSPEEYIKTIKESNILSARLDSVRKAMDTKYKISQNRVEDSLKIVESRIEDLKLLMGK